MSEELKACPFCGGEAKIGSTSVFCKKCGALIFWDVPHHARTKAKAIAAWNRRVQPDNPPLTLEQLRQMEGEPVWCEWMNVWALVYIDGANEIEFTYYDGSQNTFSELEKRYGKYGSAWIAYARKPEPPQSKPEGGEKK